MPRNSATIKTIKAFLNGGSSNGILSFNPSEAVFNWHAYQSKRNLEQLTEEKLTLDIITNWILTLLFRKPKEGEPKEEHLLECLTPNFHLIIGFLKSNVESREIIPLLEFLNRFQQKRVRCFVIPYWCVLPFWFELTLIPIFAKCGIECSMNVSEEIQIFKNRNSAVSNNLLKAISPEYTTYWLEKDEYIRNILLFQLLEDESKIDQNLPFVKEFLATKPDEYYLFMQMDLLVYLMHHGILPESIPIQKILANPYRRGSNRTNMIRQFPDSWLFPYSPENPIIASFLSKEFPSIRSFVEKWKEMSFHEIFYKSTFFFSKLMLDPVILNESGILVKEMEKFLNLNWWNTNLFFNIFFDPLPYVKTLMGLNTHWRYLFIRLYRCEFSFREGEMIFSFVKNVLKYQKVLFDADLFDMCHIYMVKIVQNSSDYVKSTFLRSILNQKDLGIFIHLRLTPQLVQFAQTAFPDNVSKRKIFWSLFMTQCCERYRTDDRYLKINMQPVCENYGLEVDHNIVGLISVENCKPIHILFKYFGIISLKLRYHHYRIDINYSSVERCNVVVPFDQIHPFRRFILNIKKFFNDLIELPSSEEQPDLSDVFTYVQSQHELIQELTNDDRSFLKNLFDAYLPKIKLTPQLIQNLLNIANLFPIDVKQSILEASISLKILDNSRKRLMKEDNARLSGKRLCLDPSDPSSYKCQCSGCGKFFVLTELCVSEKYSDASCLLCSLGQDGDFVPFNGISFSSM